MLAGHLQDRVECLHVVFRAQSRLEAMLDEGDSDIYAGLLSAAQFLRDRLDLWRHVFIWVH